MKKILILGTVALALVAVVSLGFTGLAYAQDDTPVCPFCGAAGWTGGRGGFRGQAVEGEYGPMHEYMLNALAEAFGLSPEELEAAHDQGKTLWEIAQDQGKTLEEFRTLMLEARTKAFEQMVADGVISQAQADWMLEHMNGARAGRYGAGGCGTYGGPASGQTAPGMRGGRWNRQP